MKSGNITDFSGADESATRDQASGLNPFEAPRAELQVEAPIVSDSLLEAILPSLAAIPVLLCLSDVALSIVSLNLGRAILNPILIPCVIAMLMGYAVLQHKTWGYPLWQLILWLILLLPVSLFAGGMIGGSGRDSIGHGIAVVFSGVGLVTSTPLAAFLVWRLTRPGGRLIFGLSNPPASLIQSYVVATAVGLLEVAFVVFLIII